MPKSSKSQVTTKSSKFSDLSTTPGPTFYKMNIAIFYESQDQRSINFIENQLNLNGNFIETINFSFVVWGMNQYDSDTRRFNCTQGHIGCLSDRIHVII